MPCSVLWLSPAPHRGQEMQHCLKTIMLHTVPAILFKVEVFRHLEIKLLGSSEMTGQERDKRPEGMDNSQGLFN